MIRFPEVTNIYKTPIGKQIDTEIMHSAKLKDETERKVIPFDLPNRLVEKARKYTEFLDSFFEEQETAVPVLVKALQYADFDLQIRIVLLIGGFAQEESVGVLYKVLKDHEKPENVRQLAAMQLSRLLPEWDEREPMIRSLMEDLSHPDPEIRICAASALSWEGHAEAAIPLIELLYDPDIDVQQAAVNAITNLRDERVFRLFMDRLEHGSSEQKRCILFHLWEFPSHRSEALSVYLRFLDDADEELRFDALVLLSETADKDLLPYICSKCLGDTDPRIRFLALERLEEADTVQMTGMESVLEKMVADPDREVRIKALRILEKII